MVYRREFGYTPEEIAKIPVWQVEQDWYFMSRENWARKVREELG